jgi:uncharacterized membrane protein
MLRFVNGYRTSISTMVEWHHPDCRDGDDYLGEWEKAGWWNLEPGQSAIVFGGDLADVNRFWYFFADAADGAFWAGPFEEVVPWNAFQACEKIRTSNSFVVGMRELDIGDSADFTLTFVP